jgi:hypothetical protein
VAGKPCIGVPTGKIIMKVMEGDKQLIKATVPVSGGREYLAYPVVSNLGDLAIRMVPMEPNQHCETADPLPSLKGTTSQ